MAEYPPISIEPYLKRKPQIKAAPEDSYAKRLSLFDLFADRKDSQNAVIRLPHLTSFGEMLRIACVTTTAGNLTTIHRGVSNVLICTRNGRVNRVELYGVDNIKSTYAPDRGDTLVEIFFQGDSGRKRIVVVDNANKDDPYNPPA